MRGVFTEEQIEKHVGAELVLSSGREALTGSTCGILSLPVALRSAMVSVVSYRHPGAGLSIQSVNTVFQRAQNYEVLLLF